MDFWANNPVVLLKDPHDILPTSDMTKSEQLNAILRFATAFGLILTVYFNSMRYLYIPVLVAAVTYAIHCHLTSVKHETFNQTAPKCRKPTPNNPFMNPLVGEAPQPHPCPPTKQTEELQEKYFNKGLYHDVDAVWDRENSQRQFYTIPGATTPPDRKAFLDWLYNTEYVCKQDPEAHLKNLPPRTIMR